MAKGAAAGATTTTHVAPPTKAPPPAHFTPSSVSAVTQRSPLDAPAGLSGFDYLLATYVSPFVALTEGLTPEVGGVRGSQGWPVPAHTAVIDLKPPCTLKPPLPLARCCARSKQP